jgi:hypothetical protein
VAAPSPGAAYGRLAGGRHDCPAQIPRVTPWHIRIRTSGRRSRALPRVQWTGCDHRTRGGSGLLTVAGASRRFSVGATTLRRWLRDGLLTEYAEVRESRRVVVLDPDELISVLQSRTGSSFADITGLPTVRAGRTAGQCLLELEALLLEMQASVRRLLLALERGEALARETRRAGFAHRESEDDSSGSQ